MDVRRAYLSSGPAHFDGGYVALQWAGSRYDYQLQFSVWDTEAAMRRSSPTRTTSSAVRSEARAPGEVHYPLARRLPYRFEDAGAPAAH